MSTEEASVYKPGLYPGIPYDEYRVIDAVNNTTLVPYEKSSKHALQALLAPPTVSTALRAGGATHAAILEPKRFNASYARTPKWNLRTNKGKAEAAEWAEKYPNYAPISPAEYDRAVGMRDSAWEHPDAAEILRGPGQNEVTVIWIDQESGVLCKALVDRLTDYRGYSVILDIKTSRDGSVEAFPARAVPKYAYHQQAAFYIDGLNAIAPYERSFVHLVIENYAPYCVSVMELDPAPIAEGRAQYRVCMDRYIKAKETGEFPGYPPGIEGIDIPRWAYKYTQPPR